MGKRMGRKRLYSLEKLGQTNDNAPAASIADAVVSAKLSRDGAQITTEIVIDLGKSGNALTSCSSTDTIIGVSSSTGTHSAAHIGRITEAVNGIITDAEVIVSELPVTGELDIDLRYNSSSTLGFSSSAGGAILVDSDGDAVKGRTKTGALDANQAENDYLYLATGAAHGTPGTAAQTYTSGKLVIRLIGVAVTGDAA